MGYHTRIEPHAPSESPPSPLPVGNGAARLGSITHSMEVRQMMESRTKTVVAPRGLVTRTWSVCPPPLEGTPVLPLTVLGRLVRFVVRLQRDALGKLLHFELMERLVT